MSWTEAVFNDDNEYTKGRILIIIPTRDRNQKHKEVWESIKETSDKVDVIFGLDEDNEKVYERIDHPRVKYEVNPRIRMLPTLNLIAEKYMGKYDYIGFMGDDHRPRTNGWDVIFMDKLGKLGIAYGDDLIQREAMCTAVVMTSNIIKALGYMSIPGLIHLIADIFWKELGEATGILSYIPEVVIEHLHFTVGKSEKDEIYSEVNTGSMYSQDGATYAEYKESGEFGKDIQKVNDLKDEISN